jgi:outer membrane protein OmpA-like peptidoglycan-associated protein
VVLEAEGGIAFSKGSLRLSSAAERKLEAISIVLHRFEKPYIDIVGHTSVDENPSLSDRRADIVAESLVTEGEINPDRIRVVHGVGSREPLRDDNIEAGRAINRCVEIHLPLH